MRRMDHKIGHRHCAAGYESARRVSRPNAIRNPRQGKSSRKAEEAVYLHRASHQTWRRVTAAVTGKIQANDQAHQTVNRVVNRLSEFMP